MNLRLFLLPVSFVYAALSGTRNFLYDTNVFRQKKFDTPIILVGNLSVGGTGKTPHVEYLLKFLHKDFKVATLSRGYGRKSSGFVLGGRGAKASTIGDEPMQYLSKFDDAIVSVCEDRVEGAQKLLASSNPPDVIIMDDGYQHRSINPGYKILLTAFDHLYTNDYLLPTGNLRESRSGYKRANCLVVTKCPDSITEQQKTVIKSKLGLLPHQQLFFSTIQYGDIISVNSSETKNIQQIKGTSVVLFTGIENPTPLVEYLKNKCEVIESLKFPDHHEFTEKDIKAVLEKFNRFAEGKAILLTTEKDYQRIKSSANFTKIQQLPCFYIPVVIKIDNEELFNTSIRNYVTENKRNS